MNELTKKQKEVRKLIEDDYSIIVNSKWFKKYLWMYSKLTPLGKITMSQSIDVILENPCSFAYFIFGCRADYVANKEKKQIMSEQTDPWTEQCQTCKGTGQIPNLPENEILQCVNCFGEGEIQYER